MNASIFSGANRVEHRSFFCLSHVEKHHVLIRRATLAFLPITRHCENTQCLILSLSCLHHSTDPSEHGQGRQTMTEELFLFVLSRLDSIAMGFGEFTGQVKGSFSFSLSHSWMVLVASKGYYTAGVFIGSGFPLWQSISVFSSV